MDVLKLLGCAGEGVVHRVFEVSDLREAADREVMLLDVIPERFDLRLFGAIAGEVDQVNVGSRQQGSRGGDGLARVDGVIVQRYDQWALASPVGRSLSGASGAVPQEGQQALRVDGTHLLEGEPLRGGTVLGRRAGRLGATLGQHSPTAVRQEASLGTVRNVGAARALTRRPCGA